MTMQPTPEDLARDLEADLALCEAASPGPWRAEVDHLGHWRILWRHSGDHSSVMRRGKAFDEADAAFIAAARTGWPAAIRRARAAEAELLERRAEKED
jgi:hypothetical protein